MILLQIKAYIKQNQTVSSETLKNRFDLSTDALEGLLAPLIQQGHIHQVASASCSSECGTGCASHQDTYYHWVDTCSPSINIPVEIH